MYSIVQCIHATCYTTMPYDADVILFLALTVWKIQPVTKRNGDLSCNRYTLIPLSHLCGSSRGSIGSTNIFVGGRLPLSCGRFTLLR